MLHCPRCSSQLVVHQLQQPHDCPMGKVVPIQTQHCPTSMEVAHSYLSTSPPPKCPPPPTPRHIYQNVLPPVPPRVPVHPPPSPLSTPAPSHILLMRKDAALQMDIATLHMAIAEKQLEQSRLQQELLNLPSVPQSKLTTGPGFLQPWFSTPPTLPLPRPATELGEILATTQKQLEESGWYYGQLTWQESAHLLQDSPQGTFLLRDSSSKEGCYKYSLSVQRRSEGPTSVRIQFVNGEFRLDADEKIRDLMPRFDSVGELVRHYVRLSSRKNRREVLIEQEEAEEHGVVSGLLLTRPLLKQPPRLAHAARLAIHRAMEGCPVDDDKAIQQLQLPSKLNAFLSSYSLGI